MDAFGVWQHVCAVYISGIVKELESRRAQFGRLGIDTEKVI
jgi:hypothetical protein